MSAYASMHEQNQKALEASRSPRLSYLYAMNVMKGPFPLGELSLGEDANYSYLYARDVIGGAFPMGELAIARNKEFAYMYALNALKGRFPMGSQLSQMIHGSQSSMPLISFKADLN